MTEASFRRTEEWFRADERRLKALRAADKLTAAAGYAAYPILELYLIFTKDIRIIRCTLVPLIAFVLTTVIRSTINAPRPYEKLDITPLIKKDTRGNSFPSRHTACIVIIAAAWYYIFPPVGIFLTAVSIIIMVIRPLSGVHFPVDVAAGAILSALCGIIGFVLI